MTKVFMVNIVFLCMLFNSVSTAGTLADNGNGTVTDSETLLIWQQGESNTMTWEAALTYCEGLSLAAKDYPWLQKMDWRLPNYKELLSLTDNMRYDPAINTILFPNALSSNYWSSTSLVCDTPKAWAVNFLHGGTDFHGYNKTDSYYVRCVRGGQ